MMKRNEISERMIRIKANGENRSGRGKSGKRLLTDVHASNKTQQPAGAELELDQKEQTELKKRLEPEV